MKFEVGAQMLIGRGRQRGVGGTANHKGMYPVVTCDWLAMDIGHDQSVMRNNDFQVAPLIFKFYVRKETQRNTKLILIP